METAIVEVNFIKTPAYWLYKYTDRQQDGYTDAYTNGQTETIKHQSKHQRTNSETGHSYVSE